jgi:hypothetical protein
MSILLKLGDQVLCHETGLVGYITQIRGLTYSVVGGGRFWSNTGIFRNELSLVKGRTAWFFQNGVKVIAKEFVHRKRVLPNMVGTVQKKIGTKWEVMFNGELITMEDFELDKVHEIMSPYGQDAAMDKEINEKMLSMASDCLFKVGEKNPKYFKVQSSQNGLFKSCHDICLYETK